MACYCDGVASEFGYQINWCGVCRAWGLMTLQDLPGWEEFSREVEEPHAEEVYRDFLIEAGCPIGLVPEIIQDYLCQIDSTAQVAEPNEFEEWPDEGPFPDWDPDDWV